MDIMDLISGQLGGGVVEQLSSQLGADSSTTSRAISAAVPTLIGALSRNAASESGASALAGALTRDHDGGILEDLAGFIGNGGNAAAGNGILGHVLGGRRPAVEQGISQASGLNTNQVGQLLPMLAPIVMGALGKQQRQQGLDVNGLMGLLGGARQQADSQASSLLGGLAGLLDDDGDGDVTDEVIGLGSKLLGGLFGKKR